MKTPRPTATPITLEDLQAIVDRWITTTGGGYFSELTNAVILAEETGEAARILARLYGDQRAKPSDNCTLEALADELADIIWVVAALANQTGISLADALSANILKKTTRDSTRFSSSPDPD
ncbi:MAG: nucleotide pyrophosphohydrolase [Bacteroides sp.]|nr:nucleotide pyrophosphohydrolase [Bacteroides sp.]MBD5333427.1 nucleotide pyrophosphohydrolase [Bacteroides sp.]